MKLALTFIFITFSITAFPQDTLYKKKNITTIDIEVFYSYYNQDGNHSAVTGGIGTEKLHVHSTGFNFDLTTDTSHTILVESYLDVITSASVDNIDFVVSSASYHDRHISASVGYQFNSKKKAFLIGGKYMFALESDFLSNGFNVWTSFGNKTQTRNISISVACFFDDLRWGRFNEGTGYKPTTLVYPAELRYKQWFDIYRRNSYNINLGVKQDLSRMVTIQFDLGFILQKGLISTSFHRMYYKDSDSVEVENLPRQRVQFPLGIGLNTFLSPRFILKAYYRYYWDDIGIRAHSINIETPIKLSFIYTLYPFFRIYKQTASTYFKAYKEHSITEQFYTSDNDLSAFWSFKAGLGFGFYPEKRFGNSKWHFNAVVLRYAYYFRTDHLDAHMFTVLFNFNKQ